jgi:hypothetical protein
MLHNKAPVISHRLLRRSSSQRRVNIASLTTGNYLLKIETNDDVVTKQFAKE